MGSMQRQRRPSMRGECPNCRGDVAANEEFCPRCGSFSGFPNVKLAQAQRPQLLARSESARDGARARSLARELGMLENVAAHSRAVVNTSVVFVLDLLTRDEPLYSSYARLVAAGARRPAQPLDDCARSAVEGMLYGSRASEVVYGALSTDGSGVVSYGPVALQLSDIAVERRATVLEENSYRFARRHGISPVGPVPFGYLGTWHDRSDVVVAKLAVRLDSNMALHEVTSLLLSSRGVREKDDFLEVHIWRGFDRTAIEAVKIAPQPPGSEEALLAAIAKERALSQGIRWVGA